MDEKTICLTIDIEQDFGGLLAKDVYTRMNDLRKLKTIVGKYNLKLTAFITGKSLEDNPNMSYDELPTVVKFGYRAQRLYNNPVGIFKKFVKYILALGYESKYMIDVYNKVRSTVSSWAWNEE